MEPGPLGNDVESDVENVDGAGSKPWKAMLSGFPSSISTHHVLQVSQKIMQDVAEKGRERSLGLHDSLGRAISAVSRKVSQPVSVFQDNIQKQLNESLARVRSSVELLTAKDLSQQYFSRFADQDGRAGPLGAAGAAEDAEVPFFVELKPRESFSGKAANEGSEQSSERGFVEEEHHRLTSSEAHMEESALPGGHVSATDALVNLTSPVKQLQFHVAPGVPEPENGLPAAAADLSSWKPWLQSATTEEEMTTGQETSLVPPSDVKKSYALLPEKGLRTSAMKLRRPVLEISRDEVSPYGEVGSAAKQSLPTVADSAGYPEAESDLQDRAASDRVPLVTLDEVREGIREARDFIGMIQRLGFPETSWRNKMPYREPRAAFLAKGLLWPEVYDFKSEQEKVRFIRESRKLQPFLLGEIPPWSWMAANVILLTVLTINPKWPWSLDN